MQHWNALRTLKSDLASLCKRVVVVIAPMNFCKWFSTFGILRTYCSFIAFAPASASEHYAFQLQMRGLAIRFGFFVFIYICSIQGESLTCTYIQTIDSWDQIKHFFRIPFFLIRPRKEDRACWKSIKKIELLVISRK